MEVSGSDRFTFLRSARQNISKHLKLSFSVIDQKDIPDRKTQVCCVRQNKKKIPNLPLAGQIASCCLTLSPQTCNDVQSYTKLVSLYSA